MGRGLDHDDCRRPLVGLVALAVAVRLVALVGQVVLVVLELPVVLELIVALADLPVDPEDFHSANGDQSVATAVLSTTALHVVAVKAAQYFVLDLNNTKRMCVI